MDYKKVMLVLLRKDVRCLFGSFHYNCVTQFKLGNKQTTVEMRQTK